jgi:integrase
MAIRERSWITTAGEQRTAWLADFRDASRRRVHRQFSSKPAAEKWLREARVDDDKGVFTPDSTSPTVAEACDTWIAKCIRDELEPTTISAYKGHVKWHIKPSSIGKMKVSRLTRPTIERFVDELLAAGRTRATAKKVLVSLSAVLSNQMRYGLAQNVCRDVRVTMPKRHQAKVVPPPKDEIREQLAAATGRARALLVTAVFTGMRASEIRGLRWADCDFAAKLVRVRQRATTKGKIGDLKSAAGHRDIPIVPELAQALKEWKLASGGGSELVFPGRGGRALCHNTIMSELGGTAHKYRHWYASWLIDQGFGPKRIQYLMGHSSIQVTFDQYGHLMPNEADHDKLAAASAALVG